MDLKSILERVAGSNPVNTAPPEARNPVAQWIAYQTSILREDIWGLRVRVPSGLRSTTRRGSPRDTRGELTQWQSARFACERSGVQTSYSPLAFFVGQKIHTSGVVATWMIPIHPPRVRFPAGVRALCPASDVVATLVVAIDYPRVRFPARRAPYFRYGVGGQHMSLSRSRLGFESR